MPFILFEKESETKAIVTLIHYMPDDPVEGLPDDIKSKGVYVDSLPEPLPYRRGKSVQLCYNPSTGELWHEYVDRPLTPEELMQEQNEKLDLIMISLLEQEGII